MTGRPGPRGRRGGGPRPRGIGPGPPVRPAIHRRELGAGEGTRCAPGCGAAWTCWYAPAPVGPCASPSAESWAEAPGHDRAAGRDDASAWGPATGQASAADRARAGAAGATAASAASAATASRASAGRTGASPRRASASDRRSGSRTAGGAPTTGPTGSGRSGGAERAGGRSPGAGAGRSARRPGRSAAPRCCRPAYGCGQRIEPRIRCRGRPARWMWCGVCRRGPGRPGLRRGWRAEPGRAARRRPRPRRRRQRRQR